MAPAPLDPAHQASFGLAAWAITKLLLGTLRTKRVITHEEGALIIDHALSLLEGIDEMAQDDAFRYARVQLEQWMKEWHAPLESSQSPPDTPDR
ncbi:hypothetical protein [Reyranella sp.]|uniref:hypothetical protein n=1 Tax=Reyranella sp. TaxID=1929291 RepID=UPI003C7BC5EE